MRVLLFIVALAAAFGCSSRNVVVVYSPHGPDVLKDYEARFEAAHPEVDVQWIDAGSEEVYSRVKAERGRPQGDVWWGAPSTMFIEAAEEGLLEPYRPTWADAVESSYKDGQDRWYGTYRSPLAIMFNTRKYTKKQVPGTWDALLDPAWKGKITLRKPLPSGTMRTFIGAMIMRASSEDDGLAWLRQLHEQREAYMENPQLLYDHMKKQEDLISVWLMPDVVLQRERNGFPFDYVLPAQTPVLTEGIAIIKGAPHADLAKAFYEFVTSPESLAHQAAAYGKVPARADLNPKTLPLWITTLDVDAMPIDWASFSANEDRWCERWAAEVYNAP
ncbi:MAG: extracellular solute-binding protein [Candidatus Hydrogenedentes bacterium]|nr:extracellular solute-binding protein [Candidatus Hydrogenedentota bacterium]